MFHSLVCRGLAVRRVWVVEVLEGTEKNQKPVPLCRPPYLKCPDPETGLVQCPLADHPRITSPDARRRMPVGSGNFDF